MSVESGRLDRTGRIFVTGLCAGREPQFRGVLDCFRLLYREGGIKGLWRGWVPTCARAATLSGAQLGACPSPFSPCDHAALSICDTVHLITGP
jgi:hypothetical protein